MKARHLSITITSSMFILALFVATISTVITILSSSSSSNVAVAEARRFTSSNQEQNSNSYILMSECEDRQCGRRCRQRPIPENFCHHIGPNSDITQSAECGPAPQGGKCFQETVYQHSWSQNQNVAQKSDDQCQSNRIESTQPRQCNVCLENRIHNHPSSPPSSSSEQNNNQNQERRNRFVIFTNCDSKDGSITLSTGCDSSCQNCTGKKQKLMTKQCIDDNEFGVSIEYSPPQPCPQVLLVSDFKDAQNCTGRAGYVSHTFTESCYTEGHGKFSVKYQCVSSSNDGGGNGLRLIFPLRVSSFLFY